MTGMADGSGVSNSYGQHHLGHPFDGAPGYGDVGGYAGHVSGGPDVYVIATTAQAPDGIFSP